MLFVKNYGDKHSVAELRSSGERCYRKRSSWSGMPLLLNLMCTLVDGVDLRYATAGRAAHAEGD